MVFRRSKTIGEHDKFFDADLTGRWKIKHTLKFECILYLEVIIQSYILNQNQLEWISEDDLRTVHDEDFIPFFYKEKEYVNECHNQKPNPNNSGIKTTNNKFRIFSWGYEKLHELCLRR